MIPRRRRGAWASLTTVASVAAGCASAACTPSAPGSGSGPAGSEPEVEPPRVVIDGAFDEWGACTGVDDPADAGAAELDLREVCLAHDSEALYLRLDLGRAVNAQGLSGVLSLALDVDGKPDTGWRGSSLPGVDLVIEFTHLDPDDPTRLRYGIRSFIPDPAAPPESLTVLETIDPYALGLMFEPRHTAPRIEVRLERDVPLASGVRTFLGEVARGHLAYVHVAGTPADAAGPFAIPLEPPRAPARPADLETRSVAVGDPLARAPGTAFRLLSWNVSRSSFIENPEPFRRALAALAPDVVLLDEIVPDVTPTMIREALPPAPVEDQWFIHMGSSGSAQRGAIAARAALEPAPPLARVTYPDSARRLLAGVTTQDLREVLANATGDGAPAAGAWSSVGGRRVLLVTLDLVCCGNRADAIQDRIRRMEAASINMAVRGALTAAVERDQGADAVIVGGDFNLVASRAPLDLVAAGAGPDGADLVPVYALQLDGRSSATWDGGRGQFPPGQLDYVLFSDSTLEVLRAFVMETRDLAPRWLATHAIDASDSERASDHRPIVVDFSWRGEP